VQHWLIWIIALVVGALGLSLWFFQVRARRRAIAPRRAPKLRHPVVLAHGLLGFDEIAVVGRKHHYFRNIAAKLGPRGTQFYTSRVAPVGRVEARATQLVAVMNQYPEARFNVIAHSMGGLDARYAITHLGLASRVASLVTIGAPHRGTPLANFRFLKALKPLGVAALADLTPEAMEQFNEKVPDMPGVTYCSVVATAGLTHTNPLLWASSLYLSARGGSNDGIVPASSQVWGKVLFNVTADHWAQVGWSLNFDATALYEEIIRELAVLGF
jgi:triacylglycerol lipase